MRKLQPQISANRYMARIYRTSRSLSGSVPRPDVKYPYGVPAFPISPSKAQSKPRPLPAYRDVRPKTTRNTIVFLSICGAWAVAAMVAVNYERFASPVTASTLHEVRKSKAATDLLGQGIQHRCMHLDHKGWYRYDGWFRQPWISGSIQLTKGIIDIAYNVKGSSIFCGRYVLTSQWRRGECIL
jgi:Cytochrome oxidase complex assembly protein 1